MRRLFTNSVCLALLAIALLCTVAPAAADPDGDTYPFIRNATYPNGNPWQIGSSHGIAINETGYTFITQDQGTPDVRIFDPAGNEVAGWNDTDNTARYRGIKATSQYVYVTDSANDLLRVYSLSGVILHTVTTGDQPFFVSVNSTGHAFVSNQGSNSIQVIPPGGTTALLFKGGISAWALAVNRTDYLYNAYPPGGFIDIFDRDGARPSQLTTVAGVVNGITVDPSDRVFFTQTFSGLFQGYSPSGGYIGTSQAGYLSNPTGIAVTASGEAYVLDPGSGKVSIFRVGPPPTPAPAPSGSFAAYPQSGPAPHTVQFLDYTPNAQSWRWDFGDGGTSTLQYPTHVYSLPGLYTVTLSVRDWAGATSTKTEYHYIRVTEPVTPAPTPVANFTENATVGEAPLAVQFTDTSSPAPYHRWWQFGDGSLSTDADPVHVYERPGAYTVNLTVWTPLGQATVSKPAYVTVDGDPRVPEANFTLSRTSGQAPLYVRFTDTSTGAPTSWRWDFGGFAWTTMKSPSVVFRQPGEYAVTLTVRNPYGWSSMSTNVTVTGTAGTTRTAGGRPVSVIG
ncbi:MAG: PKD domain-containing protein [Methanoregulaceae archaeon]